MDLASRKSWFAAQPDAFKVLLLLKVMHELTIVLRVISTSGDEELMRRSGWIISECNHRLVGYACGVMTQGPRYPDDVIIAILFDYLEHPLSSRTLARCGTRPSKPPPTLAQISCAESHHVACMLPHVVSLKGQK